MELALGFHLALGATTSTFCFFTDMGGIASHVRLRFRCSVSNTREGHNAGTQAARGGEMALLRGLKALRISILPITRSSKGNGSQRHRCGTSDRRRWRL